jgi:hypothetical protein
MDAPKMTSRQAKIFWRHIVKTGQVNKFNSLLKRLENKELVLKEVNVDKNENIQNIVLENKDKPPIPYEPYIKYFK